MNISFSDIIGSIGVSILLLAFVLNLLNKISRENIIYILMNLVGAALACFASYLIHYIPFIILEAVWTLISLVALLKFYKNK
jgi:VIT1/CCC1 family predicted Fe2+/Mn2+ transporter